MIRLLLLAIFSMLVLVVVVLVVFHGNIVELFSRGGAQRRMDAAQRVGLRDPATWSVTITRHVPQRNPAIGRRVVEVGERREVER